LQIAERAHHACVLCRQLLRLSGLRLSVSLAFVLESLRLSGDFALSSFRSTLQFTSRMPLLPLLLLTCLLGGCCTTTTRSCPSKTRFAPCLPICHEQQRCNQLDDKLVEARRPLLQCVARQGEQSHLGTAHRCYRALRLLESARWWLRTLMAERDSLRVYRVPSETARLNFLCLIEKLAQATKPREVERIYSEIVRSFP
jgi:hypothetical protein